MTTIINETAPASWTNWLRRKAISIVSLAGRTQRTDRNVSNLERDMRVHAAELERQQWKSRLLAGTYISMID